MRTWFTSDLHLGHQRIIELCNRPYSSVEEMDEALIENINAVVSSRDRLVILGDICMGKLEFSLPKLGWIRAAELVLLPGNHDRFSLAYHHSGVEERRAEKREEFRLRYEATRENTFALMDDAPSVWHWPMLSLPDEDSSHTDPLNVALFSHYPYKGDSQGEDRAAFLRAEDTGRPIIHGHVHEEWRTRGRQFNVGVDANEFKPVSEEELADWIRSL